jgi:hypothetical protein
LRFDRKRIAFRQKAYWLWRKPTPSPRIFREAFCCCQGQSHTEKQTLPITLRPSRRNEQTRHNLPICDQVPSTTLPWRHTDVPLSCAIHTCIYIYIHISPGASVFRQTVRLPLLEHCWSELTALPRRSRDTAPHQLDHTANALAWQCHKTTLGCGTIIAARESRDTASEETIGTHPSRVLHICPHQ